MTPPFAYVHAATIGYTVYTIMQIVSANDIDVAMKLATKRSGDYVSTNYRD